MRYEEYKKCQALWGESFPINWSLLPLYGIGQYKSICNCVDQPLLSVYLDIGVIPFSAKAEKRTNTTSQDLSKYQRVDKGDFVLNNQQAWRGSVGVSNYTGIVSPAYIIVSLKDSITSRFANYLFRNRIMVNQYLINSKGVGSIQRNIYWQSLKRITVPVPSREEQDQIVRYLDWQVSKINALVAAKKCQIKLLEEERQAVIDTFVLRSPHERETKISSLAYGIAIPLTWNVYKFNQVFNFGKGLAITKANLLPSGIPVISYGQIHSKSNTGTNIDDSLIRYVSEDYIQSSPNSLVHKGDFIFADTSEDYQGVGNCVYVDREDTLFAGYHTVIARPKDSKARRYLAYLFLSSAWRYSLRKQVNGVKVYSITQRILKNTCVILPPEDEQEEIVAYLDSQCSKISILKQKILEEIDCLHELRTRLISDVVTGQIDVRGIEVPYFDMVEEIDSDEESLEDEDTTEETQEQEE